MITHRPRRLRVSPAMRSLVAENHLHAENLILPVFVKEGAKTPTPIKNMKGVVQHTFDSLRVEVDRALQSGIGGIMVFAIPGFFVPGFNFKCTLDLFAHGDFLPINRALSDQSC